VLWERQHQLLAEGAGDKLAWICFIYCHLSQDEWLEIHQVKVVQTAAYSTLVSTDNILGKESHSIYRYI